jgi:hypothetical protein
MKKSILGYILFFVAFMFIVPGCEKSLEEHPASIISPSNFYKTDADFNEAINGAFAPLWGGYGGFDFISAYVLCAGAEDVTSRPTAPELRGYDTFKETLTDTHASGMWADFYKTINSCNGILSNLGNATEVSDDNKKIYEGEARFLRAFCYYWLTRLFGTVPIITSENQSDAINVGESSVADVYQVIISDLTIAKANLPVSFPDVGRPTKGAATTLLASAYLTMAGWPLNDASKYDSARDEALAVMKMNVYSLEHDYADLWKVSNALTSKEIIFQFLGNSANGSTASHHHVSFRPGEEGGWNDIMSEARFFYAFPDGPRKDASFHTVFTDDTHTKWENSRIGQPYIEKYRDAGDGATKDGPVNNFDGSGNWIVLRYAEVLLIYAEAANMAEGGPSAEAYEALNQVRRRAGGYNQSVYPDLTPGLNQKQFEDAVIKERAWELAFECKRWFDLVRKEMVVDANKDLYPYVSAHNMLLPKPQIEVDMIEGLNQNEGYQ